ncbi:MAG: DUF368 domain-containing protein [Candidatus Woesearchaeota archaeon]
MVKKRIDLKLVDKKNLIKAPFNYFLLYIKGLFMGLFDLVPGISGGSVALIAGIYEDLIFEINNVFSFLKSLLSFNFNKIKTAWLNISIVFIVILGVGIISGIFLSVFTLSFLLKNYFVETMGFIAGLILLSGILLSKKYLSKNNYLFGVIGLCLGIVISILSPIAGHSFSFFQIFLLGAITITAMILPGISGALILLLLGGYDFMLFALKNISDNYLVVIIFLLGAVMGLGVFSRGISYLLKKYHNKTLIFLSALMVGATTKPIIEVSGHQNYLFSLPFFILAILLGFIFYRKFNL